MAPSSDGLGNRCPGACDLEQVPRNIGSEQEVLVPPRSSDASAVYSQAGVTAKAQPEFPPGPQSLVARPWRRTQCASGDQPQAPISTFAARMVSGRETGKWLLGLHKEDFPRRSPVINLAGIYFNTPSLHLHPPPPHQNSQTQDADKNSCMLFQ